jgi:uncharacterized protein (DUF2235 family)
MTAPRTGSLDHTEPVRPDTAAGVAPRRPAPHREWRKHIVCDTKGETAALGRRKKRIVICADGTWNTPWERVGGHVAPTNVWKFYELLREEGTDAVPQLAFYHQGIGTTGSLLDRLLGGATGWGITDNIKDCYRFIVRHYQPGDALYFFGFSRGAYTVRSLAGLIRTCGIIDPAKAHDLDACIDAAYRQYRTRNLNDTPTADKAVDFRARHAFPDCLITCIGVWDTVGALGIPEGFLYSISRYRYRFHDVTLSSWVQRAFQAVAVDEHRPAFVSSLWDQQPGAKMKGQIMEQVWFPGSHGDIGGGNPLTESASSDLTLRWMVNRVIATCRLSIDTDRLPSADASPITLHDSRTLFFRITDPLSGPLYRCIDSGLGSTGARDPLGLKNETVHPSVDILWRDFATQPIPKFGVPYRPPNVADYHRRREAEAGHGPPLPPTDSDDVR